VREVVGVQRIHDYKTIKGGKNGEYVPVNMNIETNKPAIITAEIKEMVTKDQQLSVDFSGSLITGQKDVQGTVNNTCCCSACFYTLFWQLSLNRLPSRLSYCLKYQSILPVLCFLSKLWGGTINIMTMIGLIVMSGVIINDSILKVDTINNLRAEGLGLKEAIYTGGSRRLKPIIMVAMASILSTAPILFSQGMGSELQRPMALALIGGMSLGTVVSLFFIPLAYWYIAHPDSYREARAFEI
jgi:Cu/Ag efflux pump CusA